LKYSTVFGRAHISDYCAQVVALGVRRFSNTGLDVWQGAVSEAFDTIIERRLSDMSHREVIDSIGEQ
jgi:hypothetical protein